MVRALGVRPRAFGRFVTAIVAWIALETCLVFAQTSTATILGVGRDTWGAWVPGVSKKQAGFQGDPCNYRGYESSKRTWTDTQRPYHNPLLLRFDDNELRQLPRFVKKSVGDTQGNVKVPPVR